MRWLPDWRFAPMRAMAAMTCGASATKPFVRAMLAGILAGLVALSTIAIAQPPAKVVRIGYLTATAMPLRETAFRDELAKLGRVEGRNLTIEYRSANGNFDRLPALAEELARLDVDVIVAAVTQASLAAKAATRQIPVVMVAVGDPVGSGLVTNFARPGGNVTGNSSASVDIIGKQLELMREVRPALSRIAVLWNPANPVFQSLQLEEAKAAAARLHLDLSIFDVREPKALEGAFRAISNARPDALLILADAMFGVHTDEIARLALDRRLPAVGPFAHYADAGFLLSYGSDFDDPYRRAAVYADRILKGAKPADLPVERPTRFELIVNEKTAKALGITIPPALASRADRLVR